MGFFEKAKKYVKEAFEKYGDVANPGGFVGRSEEPKNEGTTSAADVKETKKKKLTLEEEQMALNQEFIQKAMGDIFHPINRWEDPEGYKASLNKSEELQKRQMDLNARKEKKARIEARKEEVRKLFATYGANPGGMIEKPMEMTEAKKVEPKIDLIAAQKRNNSR